MIPIDDPSIIQSGFFCSVDGSYIPEGWPQTNQLIYLRGYRGHGEAWRPEHKQQQVETQQLSTLGNSCLMTCDVV